MILKLRLLAPLILLLSGLLFARQAASQSGALHGVVLDPSGAAIPGAQISLTGEGKTIPAKSGADGGYEFHSLAPGVYAVSVNATGFAPLTLPGVAIASGQTKEFNLSLTLPIEKQEVGVTGQNQGVGLSSDQNTSATILRGSALDALSDDPNELQNELQALAGPAAGPNGGQLYIDGFAGGTLPAKSSILEVRVNQNPFSAEFDRLGYGRVEILTKPGSQKFEGSFAGGGTDSALDTANPLVADQPSYYQYTLVANLSGPISKNASYFFTGYRIVRQNQAIVDAIDPTDTSQSIHEAVPTPITYLLLNPRLDFQLGQNHTVTIRDMFYRTNQTGSGVGALNLASQASNILSEENALQLGDTILVNSHLVNETHFQWSHIYNNQVPVGTTPSVTVEGAFTTGGNIGGVERDTQNNFELQNYSTATAGNHALRFGMRLRLYDDTSYSTSGSNGTYTFDTVDTYAAQTPSQYSANIIKNPSANVLLFDGSFFLQDDWRWKPNFVLGMGLRLEGQNRIHDHADWAPRLALAWSPGHHAGTGQPKTVIRAGYGWFYNRFTVPNFFSTDSGTPYVDETIHDNGINEIGYVSQNPSFYNPAAPASAAQLAACGCSTPSYLSIDRHFHAALDMQTGIGIDRQLTRKIAANVTYLYTQGVHQYLMDNVNQPAFNTASYQITGSTPSVYNYQFQSGGVYRQNQLIFTASTQFKHLVLNGTYMLNNAKSDTESPHFIPSVGQNPGLDYGRAAFGYRQRLMFINSYTGPYGIVFGSLLVAQSGIPYNLTVGNDLTDNKQFNARPTYGVCDGSESGVVSTQYGCLDTTPAGRGEKIVPYGLGTGPANAAYHVRISKVIGVGPRVATARKDLTFQEGGNSVSSRGLSSGSAAVHLDETAVRRYSLTFVASAANVFNMVNLGTPNGVLLSPLFNQTQSVAGPPFVSPTPGNRTISFQVTFAF